MLYIIIPQAKISKHRELCPKSNGFSEWYYTLSFTVNVWTHCPVFGS